MIGLDTNIVVRMMADDEFSQVETVREFLSLRTAGSPAFISAIVLAETIWVLERRLGYARDAVLAGLEQLLTSNGIVFEHGGRLSALFQERGPRRLDIADHLIAWSAEAAGCTHTVTFDRRAARAVPAMELLA